MKNVLILLTFIFFVTGASLAEDSADRVGRELGEMFNNAAATLEAPPAPKPKRTLPTTIDGVPEGGRELSVRAYSYCLRGRTASGRYTEPGIVAVDPRVIPMGSRLYIPGYGWGVAADTGGAIIGNKIDVWLPNTAECYRWGVRRVKIKVFPSAGRR